eukprot:TRINITY_DN5087_c0_g1_i1.p1 TRINITY_DN5087_c0_g1~~TRINITY_DN5087_c0_g1_i1.p1  ORF type:complete len:270 (+),score=30.99 TRINITY_DN5087_c0_g1_i1:79-810(+)
MHATRVAEKNANSYPSPMNLPAMLSARWIDDETPVLFTLVHLRSARLSPDFAGQQFKVRVKYGWTSDSKWCDTEQVHAESRDVALSRFVARVDAQHNAAEPFKVALGMTCFFLAREQHHSVVRIRLLPARLFGIDIPKARSCRFSIGDAVCGIVERELSLWHGSSLIGFISFAIKIGFFKKGQLRRCMLQLGAHIQSESLLLNGNRCVLGRVVEGYSAGHDTLGTAMGIPITHALGASEAGSR